MPRKTTPRHRLRLHHTTYYVYAAMFAAEDIPRLISASAFETAQWENGLFAWLDSFSATLTTCSVTLADSLCRFLALPPSLDYLSETQQRQLARHLFNQQFQHTDPEVAWDFWFEPRRFNRAQLAVAFPVDVIHRWRAFTEQHLKAPLRIQPLLTQVLDEALAGTKNQHLMLEEGDRLVIWRRQSDGDLSIHWRPLTTQPLPPRDESPESIRLLDAPLPAAWESHADNLFVDLDRKRFWPCFWGAAS